jgi:hypothetical protein
MNVIRFDGTSFPSGTYRPMPYSLGEVCQECWLRAALPNPSIAVDPYQVLIRARGGPGCPHGGVR